MNAPTRLVLIALFSFLVPFATFGANADVMVVVNGNTETNRETYNFIRKTFNRNGVELSIGATLKPETVKVGQYRYVVVINTGVSSGTDPALKKFIEGYADKKGLYLVNLYRSKGRADLSVTTFTAAENPLGVDGITAASTWTKGPGGNAAEQMHERWVEALVAFLLKS